MKSFFRMTYPYCLWIGIFVVAPVIMTGYVPDVLGSVSMASTDRHIAGNGACGKGHKEWVKVADGGPYLKLRARLG